MRHTLLIRTSSGLSVASTPRRNAVFDDLFH
jgi:hypothetical protein